jgi:hypothetical protein
MKLIRALFKYLCVNIAVIYFIFEIFSVFYIYIFVLFEIFAFLIKY